LFATLTMVAWFSPQARTDPPQGLTALFNGKDLTGWNGMPNFDPHKLAALPADKRKAHAEKWTTEAPKHWKVDRAELVNLDGDAYLSTEQDYGDIELVAEFRVSPKADGGILLRGTPQIQIVDASEGSKGSGGLSNNGEGAAGRVPLVKADKAAGQWNRFRILQVGERTTVYLNDKLVVDHVRMENAWNRTRPLEKKGAIQLLVHSGEIRWREIAVREIPSTEANEILRKRGADGFMDVFNGKDFTGWAGPIDQYEVSDGAIVCRPKKGGTIYTKDEYGNFMARVDYKLPPAGNNGLAIRYPGQGDTAYVGMCEIQVLDDTAKVYEKLDARQYNGSAYGMVPAHRGYLRPVGEWNFEEVTIKGSTIKVELNGTIILDTDLSKVTEYMNNRPHPGKNRETGHFGFAGHNDPVAFRNIQIRKLGE
jgi:hypothetical protein